MFRKSHFKFLLLAATFIVSSITVFGQGAPISGRVLLKKGETTTPVEGANVDCYRVDIKQKCRSVKTNKRGEFSFVGIPFGARIVVAASGEGLAPALSSPATPGTNNMVITVLEGDGSVLTEEKVREAYAAAMAASGGLTEDQKKAQAEYEKKLKEITEKNKAIEEKNALVERVLKEGNSAYNSGDFDTAIAKYDEGIKADPDFVGTAPVLLNNKGSALKKRAVVNYNKEIKSNDPAIKGEAKPKALKDLSNALASYHNSYSILSKAPAGAMSEQANRKKNMFTALDGARDSIRILAIIELADSEKTEMAKSLTHSYLEVEADKSKKANAQYSLAKYLMFAYDYDGAAVEFKKSLEYADKNPDTLAYLGITLYTIGAGSGNRAQKQESLNYLDLYTKVAPKNHKLRADVNTLIKELRTKDKLKPQKMR